jgi:hypothetical protein
MYRDRPLAVVGIVAAGLAALAAPASLRPMGARVPTSLIEGCG